MSPIMFSKKNKKNPKVTESTTKKTDKTPTNIDIYTVSKARSWVAGLPLTDMGATTKQLFVAITSLNQTAVSPEKRIEIAEILLPFVKMALENLDRHFLSRSFPLPERSQKIFELKKSLLLETAGSYQLSALEMLAKNMVSKKKLLLAISRANTYMIKVLMNSYEIYAKTEKTVWHDIHHLYLIACENGIERKDVPNKADINSDEFSIEDQYKLINLVALAAPNTLRQGEVSRVRDFYKECIDQVTIISDLSVVKSKYAHIALMNSDEPATLMPISDLVNSPTSRIFDLSKVINTIDSFVHQSEKTDLGKNEMFPMLTHSLAKRMAYVLTTIRNRRFKRFPREDKAAMAIRMADVIELIRENDLNTFYDQVNEDVEDDNIYEALASEEEISSPWSDVDELAEERDIKLTTWQIENSSTGGYGLCQTKLESSTARVGELVAVKDPKDMSASWQVAVIRWMDSFRDIGLRAGLEILALHAMVVRVDGIANRDITQKLPVKGVLLPTIDGSRDEENLLFPGYIFREGDELSLTIGRQRQNVILSSIDDTVGNFSYCSFDRCDVEETPEGSIESFDEVWEFL